jgi:hypothetical protein
VARRPRRCQGGAREGRARPHTRPSAAAARSPLEAERKAREKADTRAAKERLAAEKREQKELDAELRALKKRIKP